MRGGVWTHSDEFIVVRAHDLFAVVHHVQCLVCHTVSMSGVPLWQTTYYHVRITNSLHLQKKKEWRKGVKKLLPKYKKINTLMEFPEFLPHFLQPKYKIKT